MQSIALKVLSPVIGQIYNCQSQNIKARGVEINSLLAGKKCTRGKNEKNMIHFTNSNEKGGWAGRKKPRKNNINKTPKYQSGNTFYSSQFGKGN